MEKDLKKFNIDKFQKLVNIYINEFEFELERQIELISLFTDLSTTEVEEMEFNVFRDYFNEIQKISFDTNTEITTSSITIDGVIYSAEFNGKYKPKVKEMFMINKYINKHKNSYIKYVAAIIFQPINESGNIIKDYSETGIERRAEIFNTELTIATIQPFLNILSINLMEKNEVSE
jgi:hypothetical protein